MRLKLKCAALVCAVAVSSQAFSQAEPINVVTSSVPFLRISPDARGGGMGDLGIATSPDANSGFWNLAKTPFNTDKGGVSLTYTPWLKDLGVNDVFLAAVAGYYKIDDQSAVSVGMRYFNLGSIQFTDFSGNSISTGKPTEVGLDAGYSRKLTDKFSVGVALRDINSNLTRGYAGTYTSYKAASTVAADLSFFYDNTDDRGAGFRAGLALSNLGGKVGYTNDATQKDYIPANMGIGISNTFAYDNNSSLMIGIEANKLLVPTPPQSSNGTDPSGDSARLAEYRNKGVISSWFSSFGDAGSFKNELSEIQLGIGAEYNYNKQFFARAGYFYENKNKGNRKFFTAGVGIAYNVFGLNFSYLVPSGNGVNRNPLSNTLRFSLVFNFANADQQ